MPHELLLTDVRTITLAPYEDRPLRPDEVRAEAIVSAISHGTELSLYRGASPFAKRRFDPDLRLFIDDDDDATAYPVRLGYEWVGRVNEVGAAVHELRVGDLVHLPLPHRETQVFSIDERFRAGVLGRVPDDLTPDRAIFLETAGIALQAVHDAHLKVGDRIAVFGLGALGLFTVQLARLNGAAWIAAVDPAASRRDVARGLGADLCLDPDACDVGSEIKTLDEHRGVDVAIEFSGRYAALHQALRSVRVAGTVVAAGFYQGSAEGLRLGEEWHHNRLTLLSSMRGWGNAHRDHPAWDRGRLRSVAAELLASGRLRTAVMATKRFSFKEAADAYAQLHADPQGALKVALDYQT